MIMELLQSQIPNYWKIIKTAGIKSDGIMTEFQEDYCDSLLNELLSGKKHCVLKVDQNKELVCIFLFIIQYNDLKKIKYLRITNAYGVKKQVLSDWQETKKDFIALCKKYSCVGMVAEASHDGMKKILEQIDFKFHTCIMHSYLED